MPSAHHKEPTMPDASLTTVVLAGGSNTRFWPLRAKSLLPFAGQTLLERHLQSLSEAGCERFVVVANDETEAATRAAVLSLPARVDVAVQRQPHGMGGAVLTAADAYPEILSGPVLISQAHDVIDASFYRDFLASAQEADGLIAAKRVTEYFPGAYLSLDGERVTGLVEKPPPGSEPSEMVSFVLHLHRRPGELVQAIRAAYADSNPADDHYERAIAELLPSLRYCAVPYSGDWQAIKYPWHVLGVMEVLLRELRPSATLPEGMSGPVVIEEGVRIFPGARVVGPAWIGAGTVIGNNSLVRGSMIGRGVEIGYGCEIARSHVGDGCTFHHNYVGDSVIGSNVGLGFGTVTGNWPFYGPPVRSSVGEERLKTGMDKFGAIIGSDSRTGIGTLLYPGVKVGARTFVGPGVVVTRDIPDGRMILLKQDVTDQPNPFR
jgi:UDP-N-acetylglucosamine diphosphorylase / glucose-1-phosphate thymidylyltransferase / UDP-N-acetylgalactosamine diphosphorylase / glucosamine-1-phosphate N-acetyltransferase / galactosamine-1-phosphate N-acetyltransferase